MTRNKILYKKKNINLFKKLFKIYFVLFIIQFTFTSCEKSLNLNLDNAAIKQVIISNFTPNNYLKVSVSKSKQPEDFSPVEFLSNCKVDLYEDGIFKETLPFILKDTLSGLGFYTSTFKLKQNRTYKIITENERLGIASAEEYLPPFPASVQVTLLQHVDTLNTNIKGKYMLSFQDSANAKNLYTINVYYRAIKKVIDSLGNTTFKTDFLNDVPSYTAEIPNTINYGQSFFTDAGFEGQFKTYVFDFTSKYDNSFREIYQYYDEIFFVVGFSNTGSGYYSWNLQLLPKSNSTFNSGQNERINYSSNIQNGYGHFSAISTINTTIRIK